VKPARNVFAIGDAGGSEKFMKKTKTNSIIVSAVLLAFAFTFLIGNNVSAEGIYTFSDGASKKVITFGEGKDCETFWITLPSKNSVTTVNMDISGDIQQSKLDLVFLIDTSGSMNDEWKTVCDKVNNIINNLKNEKGVDIRSKIYSLNKSSGESRIRDIITNYNKKHSNKILDLSKNELKNAAGSNLVDYSEAWMAGIIWASENHSLWRENTIKAVVPISDENNDDLDKKVIEAITKNNLIIYGLCSSATKTDMENFSTETGGITKNFNDAQDLEVIMGDAANKALSGLSLKVGGTEVWEHLDKMINKQSVGGVESSAFVKALNDYSKQHCTSYPCNVPIEICSSKPVEGNLTLSYLRISMASTISGPCQNLVPCKDNCKLSDIFVMIQNIVNCLVFISTIICLLFLVIGGLLYIFSLGNPENLTKAKNTILWALGGLALVFLAWLIVNTVMQFMGVGGGFLMWSSVG
jgi:hypothetical protein